MIKFRKQKMIIHFTFFPCALDVIPLAKHTTGCPSDDSTNRFSHIYPINLESFTCQLVGIFLLGTEGSSTFFAFYRRGLLYPVLP